MNLEYDLIFSDRRTIGITVERDRKVVVRAPKGARPEVVAAAVDRRRFWIWDKLSSAQKYLSHPGDKEFVSGESFLYLGQNVSLKLGGESRGEVRLHGTSFELARADCAEARSMFTAWYLRQAKMELVPRIAKIARAMGIEFNRVVVRDMKFRWGSCSPGGTLTFNWRIVQAPAFVVNYVVAHELAHVLESHHGPEFWNIVAVHAPSWADARKWLRQHGGRLEW